MKFKISWHHFLIVILVILLLGCLVNYLEKNNMTEGFVESEKTPLPKKKVNLTLSQKKILRIKEMKNQLEEMKNQLVQKLII